MIIPINLNWLHRYENFNYYLDEYFGFQKFIFIYLWSKLVFEIWAHKINTHFCLFFFSYFFFLTTNFVYNITTWMPLSLSVTQWCCKLFFVQYILYPLDWCFYVIICYIKKFIWCYILKYHNRPITKLLYTFILTSPLVFLRKYDYFNIQMDCLIL